MKKITKNIGFIGAGKMATALTVGVIQSNVADKSQMMALDIHDDTLKKYEELTGAAVTKNNEELIQFADVIILAVKPQVLKMVISPLASQLTKKHLIISIAAGITLEQLEEITQSQNLVRVMPNTPLLVGKGASAYAVKCLSEENKKVTEAIFSSAGIVYSVEEKHLDAVTALSGSGPAYFFEFTQLLAKAAINEGLPEKIAMDLAIQTAWGAASMMKEKIDTPEQLRINVTSPNGTTQAALESFEKGNFKALIQSAITSACDRSKELSQKS